MNRPHYYILDANHVALPVFDLYEWGKWFETNDRQVAKDIIDGWLVSTVFLGLDHQFGGGEPLLFETMVFAPEGANDYDFGGHDQDRYSTYSQAIAGHERLRSMLELELNKIKQTVLDKLSNAVITKE